MDTISCILLVRFQHNKTDYRPLTLIDGTGFTTPCPLGDAFKETIYLCCKSTLNPSCLIEHAVKMRTYLWYTSIIILSEIRLVFEPLVHIIQQQKFD